MQRPSLLVREQPLDALCHHFGVAPTPGVLPTPPIFEMPVFGRDGARPTHILAASAPDQPSTPPLMLPIDATAFAAGFPLELPLPDAAPPRPGTTPDTLALPVVPLVVPHPGTLPLLLLFGMRLEREPNVLAWALLPVSVVEEFPNAAAMALVLARVNADRFERVFRHNQGLWRNVLALGLADGAMYQLVQTAWNVTAEARRIRQRGAV